MNIHAIYQGLCCDSKRIASVAKQPRITLVKRFLVDKAE